MREQSLTSEPAHAEPPAEPGRLGEAWRGAVFLAVLLVCLTVTVVLLVAIAGPSAGAAGGCGGG